MTRRAFTLIELLVVIAIIAILAAILFPVFAQAKASAKAAGSLSNCKQIGLAGLLYSGDVDDQLPMAGTWNGTDPDSWVAAGGYTSWALAVDPYQKSVDMNVSPLGGTIFRPTDIKRRIGTRLMTYGYNYGYLSPSPTTAWPVPMQSLSATAVNAPADTVMFTERAHPDAYNRAIYWYGAGTGWMIMGTAETPFCYNEPDIWCTDGWGYDSWYNTTLMPNKLSEGSATGMNATKGTTNITTTFVDGHAKRLAPGALAAGTNWNATRRSSEIVLTDATRYIWDTKQ